MLMMMMLSLALHAVEGLAFLAERGATPAGLFARACLLFALLAPGTAACSHRAGRGSSHGEGAHLPARRHAS